MTTVKIAAPQQIQGIQRFFKSPAVKGLYLIIQIKSVKCQNCGCYGKEGKYFIFTQEHTFDNMELHTSAGRGWGNGREASRGDAGGRTGQYSDTDDDADRPRRQNDAAVVSAGNGGARGEAVPD